MKQRDECKKLIGNVLTGKIEMIGKWKRVLIVLNDNASVAASATASTSSTIEALIALESLISLPVVIKTVLIILPLSLGIIAHKIKNLVSGQL